MNHKNGIRSLTKISSRQPFLLNCNDNEMIRIFIADDHPIILKGLKQVLSAVPNFKIIGDACDGEQILSALKTVEADVLLLDMSMPGLSGISLVQKIKERSKSPAILVFTMHQEIQYAVPCFKAGASGFLSKTASFEEIIAGINKLAAGSIYFSSKVAEKIIQQFTGPVPDFPHTRLSLREFETLGMLIEGKSINEIARLFCLSNKTVSTYKANIFHKLEINSSVELVYYALKHGLINSARTAVAELN